MTPTAQALYKQRDILAEQRDCTGMDGHAMFGDPDPRPAILTEEAQPVFISTRGKPRTPSIGVEAIASEVALLAGHDKARADLLIECITMRARGMCK